MKAVVDPGSNAGGAMTSRAFGGRVFSARLFLYAATVAALTGCGSWFGDSDPPPLPGERISVLMMEQRVEPDPRLADLEVVVPSSVANGFWAQAGGYPGHAMGNPALGADPRPVWRADIGQGSSSTLRLMAQPIIVEGRIYTLDAAAGLAAHDEATGRQIWRVGVRPPNERSEALGGGVAFAQGRLFVTTGYGEALSIDPANGGMIWRQKVAGPVRAAPTVIDGRVFVVTVDNQLITLSAEDGSLLWSHTGILETAGLLGAASPAADQEVVVAAYSSGELFALRVDNGRSVWSDNLAAVRRVGALAALADIRGLPVIDRGLVFAISHSGRMVAIDQRTGARVWEQEIGGINTPWVAGEFVYVFTNDGELVALTRQAGRIRWITPLERYENPNDRTGPIIWAGPVMAGGRLWLVNSVEELVEVDPKTGTVIRRIELPDGSTITPVVANETLYVLTDAGTLIAYR